MTYRIKENIIRTVINVAVLSEASGGDVFFCGKFSVCSSLAISQEQSAT